MNKLNIKLKKMLKLILKLFFGFIFLKTVYNNESCPHWSEWKKFKNEYHISFDSSDYQLTDLNELNAYLYLKILFLFKNRSFWIFIFIFWN